MSEMWCDAISPKRKVAERTFIELNGIQKSLVIENQALYWVVRLVTLYNEIGAFNFGKSLMEVDL